MTNVDQRNLSSVGITHLCEKRSIGKLRSVTTVKRKLATLQKTKKEISLEQLLALPLSTSVPDAFVCYTNQCWSTLYIATLQVKVNVRQVM